MKWYPFGHDFGNAEMSAAMQVGSRVVTRSIPTAFTAINVAAMQSLGVEVNKTEASHLLRLEGESTAFAIGELALKQDADAWNGRGDIHRYASGYSVKSLLAHAGQIISDEEFGIYVVTGLPAETYIKNQELRKTIRKALKGTYTFSLDGKGRRTAHIEVGNVLMEGAGALIAYGKKDEESRKREEVPKTPRAVVDIGGRTTDLYVEQDGQPLIELCKGKPIGVETASAMVRSGFEARYGREPSLLEVRRLMYAYATGGKKGNYPALASYGKAIAKEEVYDLVHQAVLFVTNQVVTFVASSWRQGDGGAVGASFAPVLNIGGGFFYFYNTLKERIPHLDAPDDPVHANARGYCVMVARQLARKEEALVAASAQ